jgi:transcriptional regulator with XRE-family HTH domain
VDRPGGRYKSETERLQSFGRLVRRARQCAGLSQQRLAERAAVSQTAVSRLERGVAPRLPLERLLALQQVLGGCLPLGVCPHEHTCIWQPRSRDERDYLRVPGGATQRATRYRELKLDAQSRWPTDKWASKGLDVENPVLASDPA